MTAQIADPNWAQLLNRLQPGNPSPSPQVPDFTSNPAASAMLANAFANAAGGGGGGVDLSAFLGGAGGLIGGSNPRAPQSYQQAQGTLDDLVKNNVQGVREGMLSGALSGFSKGGWLGMGIGAVLGGIAKDQNRMSNWQNHWGQQGFGTGGPNDGLNNPAAVIFNPGAALLAKLGATDKTLLGKLANPTPRVAAALGFKQETPGAQAYDQLKGLDPSGDIGRSLTQDQIAGALSNAFKSSDAYAGDTYKAFGGANWKNIGTPLGTFIEQAITNAQSRGIIPKDLSGVSGQSVYKQLVAPALDSYINQQIGSDKYGYNQKSGFSYGSQVGGNLNNVMADLVAFKLQQLQNANPAPPTVTTQPVPNTPQPVSVGDWLNGTASSLPSLTSKQIFAAEQPPSNPNANTLSMQPVGFGNGGGALGIQTQRFVKAL